MKGGRSKAAESKKADAQAWLSVRKGAVAAKKKPAAKKGKAEKDPNKPKRPASAFFVFMEDFRKQYKEKHPNNKSVAAPAAKNGSRCPEMKKPHTCPSPKRGRRSREYEKNLQAYHKKANEAAAAEEEESDKLKSEVNNEDGDDEDGSAEEGDE